MTAPLPRCQPGIAIDPAELWERYLAEVRGNGGEPSPQGAMAFASEYYYDTASELTREISNVAEREAAALKSQVEELTKALEAVTASNMMKLADEWPGIPFVVACVDLDALRAARSALSLEGRGGAT